jgi:HSP20 family protein
MTVKTPSAMNNHIHPKASRTDRYRSLEHALASKYVQLVLARRRRVAAVQGGVSLPEAMRPRLEICDEPQSRFVTATFELPGLKKEEIGVHLTNDGRLTISGDRRPPPLLANTDPTLAMYHVKEFKYGRFERTINVPPGLQVCLQSGLSPHSRIRSTDSSHPGQGHKCVLGGWHA